MEASLLAPSVSSHAISYVQELDASDIPTPFPRELLPSRSRSSLRSSVRSTKSTTQRAQVQLIGQHSSTENVTQTRTALAEALSVDRLAVRPAARTTEPEVQSELRPSLEDLRDLCLAALLTLFPESAGRADLQSSAASISARRHSAPVSPGASSSVPIITDDAEAQASMEQLLQNLRSLEQSTTPDNIQSPVQELSRRLPAAVQATLRGLEADLALALSSLLVNIERLPQVDGPQPAPARSRPSTARTNSRPTTAQSTASDQNQIYETLGRQVLSVRAHQASSHEGSFGSPTSMAAQQLWDEINRDMELVLTLCRARTPGPIVQTSPQTPDLVSLEAPTQTNYFDHLPPEYDYQDYPQDLPMYEHGESLQEEARAAAEKKRSSETDRAAEGEPRISSEKMRIDLEAITSAIDRLYQVAPQLHNQRVELDGKKLEEMESARKSGAGLRNALSASELAVQSEASKLVGRGRMTDQTAMPSKRFSTEVLRQKLDIKGKGKARDDHSSSAGKTKGEDLDRILLLIDKSSGDQRRLSDQRVDYGDFQYRMERAKLKDQKKKEQLVEQLIRHSTAGRLSTQDAVFNRDPLRKNMVAQREHQQPEALLSLPEFMKESVPPASISKTMNPHTLLTLPEFFQEQSEQEERLDAQFSEERGESLPESVPMRPTETAPQPYRPVSLIRKIARSRSNSAPPLSLAWFKSGAAVTARYVDGKPMRSPPLEAKKMAKSGSNTRNSSFEESIQVFYVAEYHQNLHSVQVYLSVQLQTPGYGIEMEVLPSEDGALTGSDQFIIRSKDVTSAPLPLPVPVTIGPHNLKVFGDHFEIKLDIPPLAQIPAVDPSEIPRLLDATQIEDMEPTTFICSSCSLPVIQCAKISDYRDLPSEHWAELVDAWMCHPDQKLSQSVTQHGNGAFAPSNGQAMVGGSYILFDESAVVKDTLIPPSSNDGDRATVRCRCGAIIGRSMQNRGQEGLTYRLAKYALRPVSPTLEPVRIPLSAYVVADMVELQQAHATHRFVVTDEEEDRPRMLIWLFNPTVRMSYMSATHYALPEQSTLLAAKVFYTLIGPSSPLALNPAKINEQYPAFKTAETISYPMAICRRLAAMLKESTELYPPIRKSMMQLDVGWLQRG